MGCVTGKSVSQGGIQGSDEAPGIGAYYAMKEILEDE
jgi:glutamate dehydrogenase (NAD(P)+)